MVDGSSSKLEIVGALGLTTSTLGGGAGGGGVAGGTFFLQPAANRLSVSAKQTVPRLFRLADL
jgi:hypothetical protein